MISKKGPGLYAEAQKIIIAGVLTINNADSSNPNTNNNYLKE